MDPNWLATVIEVVITLFVFLLGVPTLIFQTFVPGYIRKIFNERIGKKFLKNLIGFGLAVILYIIVLGNHGIYAILEYWFPEKIDSIEYIWYLFTFLFFISFFYLSFLSFMDQLNFFSGGIKEGFNPHEVIMKELVESFRKYYPSNRSFSKKDKNDLFYLGRMYTKGVHKGYFIKGCKEIMEKVMKDSYKGGELKKIGLYEIIRVGYESKDDMAKNNIYYALEMFNSINNSYFNTLLKIKEEQNTNIILSAQDIKESIDITYEFGIKSLSHNELKNVNKAYSIIENVIVKLKSFKQNTSPQFNSNYEKKISNLEKEAQLKMYQFSKEIYQSKKFTVFSTVDQKLKEFTFDETYVFALLATLSSINQITSEHANKIYKSLSIEGKESKLKNAEGIFIKRGEFDAAQMIRNFINQLNPIQPKDFIEKFLSGS